MDQAKLLERLMVTFLGELGEHLRTLNGDILALEKGPDGPRRAEHFKTLLRAAHSLKGAARSVSVDLIEEACHRLEEVLVAARDGLLAADAGLFALLFEAVDAIEEAGMRLREQHGLNDSPLAALLPRLESMIGQAGPRPDPPPAPPPPAAVPIPPRRLDPRPDVPIERPVGEFPPIVAAPASSGPERAREGSLSDAFVRVPAEKLDALLSRNGELLVARRRVEGHARKLRELREFVGRWRQEWGAATRQLDRLIAPGEQGPGLGPRAVQALAQVSEHLGMLETDLDRFTLKVTGDHRQFARAAGLLDDEVRRMRMLPFAEVCEGLDRLVRDLAMAEGKRVELAIAGGEVELDRSVLEGLKDPLTHLVRNAVGHGIEAPERRREAGKLERGRVTVTASLRGSQVEVVVADDGAGIDREALLGQASRRGIAPPADERDLIDLIFLPGISTAPLITNISGRGVGLDVVKSRVEALHGTTGVASTRGLGTRFTLAVPLTLTTLRVLLVKAGTRPFAVPVANVSKLVRVDPKALRSIKGRETWVQDGPPLPVILLSEVLGLPPGERAAAGGKVPGLIVVTGERRLLFVVDELIAEQEVIVKSLGHRIRRVRFFSGATFLADGAVALVINAAGLVQAALARTTGIAPLRPTEAAPPARKRLLVVDDSITTRTLEKSILEASGYEVAVAVDGEAGWNLLQAQGADLLISDIEMPRMDGFALTATVRSSPRFASLPIILFSSRASDRDKARGIEVGADAYIVKGAFDQTDLLETIAQLL